MRGNLRHGSGRRIIGAYLQCGTGSQERVSYVCRWRPDSSHIARQQSMRPWLLAVYAGTVLFALFTSKRLFGDSRVCSVLRQRGLLVRGRGTEEWPAHHYPVGGTSLRPLSDEEGGACFAR